MAPLLAHAGMVKLLPDAHVDITNGLPVVAVELFNAGNEPVRVLEVEAEDGSQRSEVRSQKSEGNLQPGEFFRRSIPLPLPPDRPGIYQAVSRIHYEDSSGVPFSSVMVSEFRWKIQGAAEQADAGRQCAGVPSGRAGFIPAMHVAGIKPALPVVPSTNAVSSDEPPMELPSAIDTIVSSLCDATLGRSGTVRVDLELLQDDPVDAMVRLVLPDELGCSTPERQVRLEPDVRRSETFQIENRGALCGGVYPVYAIVEHTAGGRHQSSSAAGSVTVTEWQGSGQSYWVWLGAALGLLIALLAGRPKNTKSSEQKPLRQAQGRSQSAQRESGEDSPPASLETPRHREEKNNVAGISPTGVPVTKIPATLLEGRGEREERFCVLKNLLLLFGFLQKTVARILAGVLTRRNSRNIIFSSRCLGVSSEAGGKCSSFAGFATSVQISSLPMGALVDLLILSILTAFILWQLSPADLIRNTTTVGGDTPSHLYLVSHLRHELFHHGRIISWAGGWWCGFPMFQYYFVLPYLSAALLSVVIPLNIAFKLVSVAGLVLTPWCAYGAGRLWRLPRPTPAVLAIAMVPFLFVHSHTMWGVNTASTLAGMIANSWSFALMLPALASACRDAGEGRFRWRTVLLMVLVLASHFFTSVVMFLSLAIVPVEGWRSEVRGQRSEDRLREREALGGRDSGEPLAKDVRRQPVAVLLGECVVAVLLMAWWIVPLVLKSGFSMDFGTNWQVTLWKSFPEYTAGLLVFGAVAVIGAFMYTAPTARRPPEETMEGAALSAPVGLLCWMLAISVLLFKYGFSLSPVFVNVRLWPFIFFAMMALAAIGVGSLLAKSRGSAFIVILLAIGVLLGTKATDSLSGRITGPGLTRVWAGWNYSGLESKPAAPVFKKLLPLLKGTPGRLANDLCEENNQLGSSRVFELVPYLIGKPVLEGGLVNSALGSMYSYSIQGETSDSCAGFPPIVTPQPFNFATATRHLELFNVKHFIARSERTKQALRTNPEWRPVAGEQDWELFELTSHDGRTVFVPPRMPVVVETARWKECSLEWLYTVQALDQFAIWAPPKSEDRGQRSEDRLREREALGGRDSGEPLGREIRGWAPPAPGSHGLPCGTARFSESQFLEFLAGLRRGESNRPGIALAEAGTSCISHEEVADDHIRFTTSAIGRPHIIKVSWFPNWKVHGASQVYRVSPGFMLVFPDEENVELYYGTVWSDWLGYGLTVIGLLAVLAMGKRDFTTRFARLRQGSGGQAGDTEAQRGMREKKMWREFRSREYP